ncbi:MAG: hypothetical protein AB7L09_22270 [Nitrospira sp.]
MSLDLGQVVAIGGPTSAITAVFVVLVNAYLSARKDRREQQAAEVQTGSGLLDNAQKLAAIAHGESDRLLARVDVLVARLESTEEKNRQLEHEINRLEDLVARQQRQIEWLMEDLTRARDPMRRQQE